MKVRESHRVEELVLLKECHESGLSYRETGLLQQRFSASAPLEKLVTDVTEMRVLGGRLLYLSSIMDLHNNMVLAHSVLASNSWPMVREMLERLRGAGECRRG